MTTQSNYEFVRAETTQRSVDIEYVNLSGTATHGIILHVRAWNAGGWSDWSPYANVTIPRATAPDIPGAPRVVPTPGSETTSLDLTWDEPAPNGPTGHRTTTSSTA